MSHLFPLHFQIPVIKLDQSRNLKILYAIVVLRDLVNKLAFFFVPLFVYQVSGQIFFLQKFNLTDLQRGIVAICLYFFLLRITTFLSAIPIGKLIAKIGFTKIFFIAHVLYILFFLSLYRANTYPLFIFLATIIDGLQINFFWNSYHTLFSKSTYKKHLGEDLGLLHFLLNLVTAVSPAIGGFLIVLMGYESLFLLALLLTAIGLVFSLLLENKHSLLAPSWREFFIWLKDRQYQRLALSFAGEYIHSGILSIWPVYVFLILGTVDKVGFLYTFSLFAAMLLSFFVGFYIDHEKSKKPFWLSGGFLSFLWICRGFILTVWSIAVVETLERIASNFHWIFFSALLMKRAKGDKDLSFFVYRELILSIAAMMLWVLVAVLFIFLPNWKTIFLLGAVGILLTVLIKDSYHRVE